ncbi:MAG: 4Fe-4S dicluster domain-containing protein [Desulfosalsimonas sp.]
MESYIDKIKEISKRLLEEGKVDMVVGYRRGSVPTMHQPFFARSKAEVDELVWDSNCGLNLANYITDSQENIGILATGCNSRNIAVHIVEGKVKREQLHIIGIPCKGMIDRHKLSAMAPAPIASIEEDEEKGKVTISGEGFSDTLNKTDVMQENCTLCLHRNPVIYDELVAQEVAEQGKDEVDPHARVKEIEAMSPEDKWAHFDDLLSDCIRCYACRNACPLCYCPLCFVDESHPQWVGKSLDPTDVRTFHFLRAYHCAGRCTDCGACVRSCPVGINVRDFTKKLEKDCMELFGWEAGLTTEQRPPLDTYKPDDPEEFIK